MSKACNITDEPVTIGGIFSPNAKTWTNTWALWQCRCLKWGALNTHAMLS